MEAPLQTGISEALSRVRAACGQAARKSGDILKVIETWAKARGLSVSVKPVRLHIHPITGAQRRASGVFP